MTQTRSTLILDRDGTLVWDRHYLSDPADLKWLPGAEVALRELYGAGYMLLVISNQSGVGRGLFSIQALERVNARLCEMAKESGFELTRIYCCPHAPEMRCACRKPNIALLQQSAAEHDFSPADALVLGDKDSDVEFGHRAGAQTLLLSDTKTSTRANFHATSWRAIPPLVRRWSAQARPMTSAGG